MSISESALAQVEQRLVAAAKEREQASQQSSPAA